MNPIVVGLKYESGMNFHELVCLGLNLNEQEQKELLIELRRRYPDFISPKVGSTEVKLNTRISDLSCETVFVPMIIPSGNHRFKNVYLFSCAASNRRGNVERLGQASERLNESAIREMVVGVFNDEPVTKQFAKQALAHAVGEDPNCISQLLLIGAALKTMMSAQTKRRSPSYFDDAVADEIECTRLPKRDRHAFCWLPGFRLKRKR